jgi:hypothetical protein
MYPINIATVPNLQVIHFDACLAVPCGDLSYQRQLSQEDKYLCPKEENSANGQGPCLDEDDVWWTTQPQGWTSDPNIPSSLRGLSPLKPKISLIKVSHPKIAHISNVILFY